MKQWIKKGAYDFILAAGDDRIDEDIFSVLSEDAYTIKVGSNPSLAQFSVRSVDQMRDLLMGFLKE